MVLQMRGTVNAQSNWDVMVDLFFYREPEETKEEEVEPETALEAPAYGGAGGFAQPQGNACANSYDFSNLGLSHTLPRQTLLRPLACFHRLTS